MLAFAFATIISTVSASTLFYDGFVLDDNLPCHQAAWPPMEEIEIGTKFYLYNPSNPTSNTKVVIPLGDTSKLLANGFDQSRNTHFVIHGYNSNSLGNSYMELIQAFIDVEGANVIAVDWAGGANVANYNKARQNIRVVGNKVALFAEDLNGIGQDFSKIHFAGHSLGAHTSGYAGEALGKKGHTVARITGLDPAGPGFTYETDPACRLDPSDADFVDNIHTDTDAYGTPTEMGHVDFYPNGGESQPNCVTDIASCSHSKVREYYTESIYATSCKFISYECSSWDNYEAGSCTDCGGISDCCNNMGYWAVQTCPGKRHLKTNGKPQYCIE